MERQADYYDAYDYGADVENTVETVERDMVVDKRVEVYLNFDDSANITSVENVDLANEILDAEEEEEVVLDTDAETYESYKRMTPLEKAQSFGFTRLRSYGAVEGVVKLKFMDLGHAATVDEFMEATELIYKGMRELVVRFKVKRGAGRGWRNGTAFYLLDTTRKGRIITISTG